jgi:hypothetical protein
VDQFDLRIEPTTKVVLDIAVGHLLHAPIHGYFSVRHVALSRHPVSKRRMRQAE